MANLRKLKGGQRQYRPWWKGGRCANQTWIWFAWFEGLAIPLYPPSLLRSFYIICHIVLTLHLCSGQLGEPHQQINMSLFDFQHFHSIFIEHWAHWVQRAPASWKQDGFLTQNSLVGITLCYGRNQWWSLDWRQWKASIGVMAGIIDILDSWHVGRNTTTGIRTTPSTRQLRFKLDACVRRFVGTTYIWCTSCGVHVRFNRTLHTTTPSLERKRTQTIRQLKL